MLLTEKEAVTANKDAGRNRSRLALLRAGKKRPRKSRVGRDSRSDSAVETEESEDELPTLPSSSKLASAVIEMNVDVPGPLLR